MASSAQRTAARRNIKKATAKARRTRSIANLPKSTRSALGRQGAAVARRKRTGGSRPKTRAEFCREAQRRGIAGRSKMSREQLMRALRRS